jgi:hypothetical protein
MKRLISDVLPEPVKARLRPYLDQWKARKLAATTKRVDICATQLAHVLSLADCPPLAGSTCLEIGSGWVLSHAIVCHLLGAKRILASDIAPIAHPEYLSVAIGRCIPSVVRDILSPYEEHGLLRSRLQHLRSIRHFDFEVLRELGIEYVAPVDIAKQPLGVPFDFVYSNSVLEHVPCEDVPALLDNLLRDLSPGGTMIHSIHLEDHYDIDDHPFDFLSLSKNAYPRWRQTNTGNRIRASAWDQFFRKIGNSQSRFIYSFSRADVDLPRHIDESIEYRDELDLRTTHLGVLTKKDGQAAFTRPRREAQLQSTGLPAN